MKRTLAIAVAALASLVAAAPAAADSIVYIKDHNVWIAEPDGSKQHQVTTDGQADWPYGTPTQADDGTIVARRGTDIVRLRQNGQELSRFDPPDTTDSAGQIIGGTPANVAVSPDGSMVAYTYYHANCPPGVSCGTRYITLYSHSDRATPPETFGKLFRNSPSWVSNSRILAFGGFLRQVNYDSPGGHGDDVHWFDDLDLFGVEEAEDLADGELSPGGDRFVAIRSYGENTHLMFYKVTENVISGTPTGPPAYACNTGNEATLDSPTWSPDGRAIAFAHKEGIEVIPLPSVEEGCPGASSGTVVLPGASEPDWGPAGVNPGPRPGTGVVVPDNGDKGKPNKGGKASKRARALRKCKTLKRKSARQRCVRKVKRKFRKAKRPRAAVAVAAAPAAAAPAAASSPTCTIRVQPAYRHSAVLRRGLPVRVTCDGPARLMAFLQFDQRSRAHRWTFENLYTESDPGAEAFTRDPVEFEEAGTRTLRLRFWPWAQRVAARFDRTRVHLALGIDDGEGGFVNRAGPGRGQSVLVR